MKLSFYAKPDHMVNRPGGRSVGAPPRYVGRRYVAVSDKAGGIAAAYPATSEPESFDLAESDPVYADLVRYCAKGGLWPADEATATACGVEFTAVSQEKDSGEWMPKAAPSPSPRASAPKAEPKE